MKSMFWDREGKPIGGAEAVLTWAAMLEDSATRIVSVDQDEPGLAMVSTIWQGLDLAHSLLTDPIPMIFETVYMVPNDDDGDAHIEEWAFAATEEEALENHAEFCRAYLKREPAPDNGLKGKIIQREKELRDAQ